MNARRTDVRARMQRIREVLLADWDPLSVGDNPELADEYDAVLPKIMRATEAGATIEELASELAAAEEWYGVGTSRLAARLAVSAKLRRAVGPQSLVGAEG